MDEMWFQTWQHRDGEEERAPWEPAPRSSGWNLGKANTNWYRRGRGSRKLEPRWVLRVTVPTMLDIGIPWLAQWLKDPAWSLLRLGLLQWRGFDPGPGDFHMLGARSEKMGMFIYMEKNDWEETHHHALSSSTFFRIRGTKKTMGIVHTYGVFTPG